MCVSQNLQSALRYARDTGLLVHREDWPEGTGVDVVRPTTDDPGEPLIFVTTADGKREPWHPTHKDILADDWTVDYRNQDQQQALEQLRQGNLGLPTADTSEQLSS